MKYCIHAGLFSLMLYSPFFNCKWFPLVLISPRQSINYCSVKKIFFYYLALKFGYFLIQLYRYTELFFLRRSMKSKNGSGHPALLNECYKLILKKNDNKLILIRAFSPAVALFS